MAVKRNDRLPAADVLTGVSPDRLLLVPRNREDKHRLHSMIRERFPSANSQLAAEGIVIASLDAAQVGLDSTDLRWSDEARQIISNRRRALELHSKSKLAVDGIVAGGIVAAREFLHDLPDLRVLDPHQWVNVACMTLNTSYGLCVFDEQGAGKTVTTIFAFDSLVERNLADFVMIVAPKSMIAEWPSDFSKFVPDRYDVQILTGAYKVKKAILAAGADVIVTNFESAVSMEDELASLLAGYKGKAVIVVDESFYAKNLDAKRTLALRRLREWCGRAFVLCGTPAPNSRHDLIQQFNIVDFGMTFHGTDIPEERAEARSVIQRLISEKGLYVRHQKSQVLPDLPSKAFNRAYVSLEPQQVKLYECALNSLITDLHDTDDEVFKREVVSFLARRPRFCKYARTRCPSRRAIARRLRSSSLLTGCSRTESTAGARRSSSGPSSPQASTRSCSGINITIPSATTGR